jgi:hypothetical protein
MTPRQKRTIATLAITDIAVVLALVVLVTRPSGTSPSPLPTPHAPTSPQQTCQWQATQLLARAGLGGTLTVTPDGLLRFEIIQPIAPGQTADEVAQSVWAAFDIALSLQEQKDECAIFTQVEVIILAHSSHTDTQISASVSAADLAAFSAGELSEEEFIERVTYTISVKGS